MDKLVEEATIEGKKVRCVLIFNDYNEKKYKKDFTDFVNYQKKVDFNKETLAGDLDLKFYNIKEFTPIPYEDFKKLSLNFISKIFFDVVKENPSLVNSDELNLQLKVLRIPNRSYYFDNDYKATDQENAPYLAAGVWFIQTVVAPYVYFKKIDFNFVKRYLVHELLHYSDLMKGYMLFETKYKDRIFTFSKRKSAYCLNYLWTSIFNLRTEGLADFVTRKDSNIFEIDINGIKEYNININKLTKMRLKKEAEEFYPKKIGWETLAPGGEYANGRMMCVFVTMYIAKIMKSPYAILIGNKKIEGYEFSELNSLLSSNKKIKVMNFSRKVFDEAVKLIQKNDRLSFIKLYEDVCNSLGISEENMTMTRNRFGRLQNQAVEFAKEERKKRLVSKGYVSFD